MQWWINVLMTSSHENAFRIIVMVDIPVYDKNRILMLLQMAMAYVALVTMQTSDKYGASPK